mmetsp:Transcript_27810/g.70256  ORF Transcript_27810/g.70256 Transcript_27810/m.70256 type:complete len:858 (-) Transcript_27810:463-3036(-)|eukprot:g2904.t1
MTIGIAATPKLPDPAIAPKCATEGDDAQFKESGAGTRPTGTRRRKPKVHAFVNSQSGASLKTEKILQHLKELLADPMVAEGGDDEKSDADESSQTDEGEGVTESDHVAGPKVRAKNAGLSAKQAEPSDEAGPVGAAPRSRSSVTSTSSMFSTCLEGVRLSQRRSRTSCCSAASSTSPVVGEREGEDTDSSSKNNTKKSVSSKTSGSGTDFEAEPTAVVEGGAVGDLKKGGTTELRERSTSASRSSRRSASSISCGGAWASAASSRQRSLEKLQRRSRRILGERVCDLSVESATDFIRENVRDDDVLLLCGGDGTVNWVVSALQDLAEEAPKNARVVPVPLGTGNDFSRALGWGEYCPGVMPSFYNSGNLQDRVFAAKKSRPRTVDVWQVIIVPRRTGVGATSAAPSSNHDPVEAVPAPWYDDEEAVRGLQRLRIKDATRYAEVVEILRKNEVFLEDELEMNSTRSPPLFQGYFVNYCNVGLCGKLVSDVGRMRSHGLGKRLYSMGLGDLVFVAAWFKSYGFEPLAGGVSRCRVVDRKVVDGERQAASRQDRKMIPPQVLMDDSHATEEVVVAGRTDKKVAAPAEGEVAGDHNDVTVLEDDSHSVQGLHLEKKSSTTASGSCSDAGLSSQVATGNSSCASAQGDDPDENFPDVRDDENNTAGGFNVSATSASVFPGATVNQQHHPRSKVTTCFSTASVRSEDEKMDTSTAEKENQNLDLLEHLRQENARHMTLLNIDSFMGGKARFSGAREKQRPDDGLFEILTARDMMSVAWVGAGFSPLKVSRQASVLALEFEGGNGIDLDGEGFMLHGPFSLLVVKSERAELKVGVNAEAAGAPIRKEEKEHAEEATAGTRRLFC